MDKKNFLFDVEQYEEDKKSSEDEKSKEESKKVKQLYFDESDERKVKIENLYIRAKLGSSSAENLLLFELMDSTLSLSYFYAKSLKGTVSLSFEDLRDLVPLAYKRLMDVSDVLVDCEKFFKLLYIQEINGAIRALKSQYIKRANQVYEDLLNNDYLSEGESNTFSYSNEGREILDLILGDPRSRLTEKEKFIITMVAHSYSIQEIADELNVCYSVAYRKYRAAIKKCKEYIEKYHCEINKIY